MVKLIFTAYKLKIKDKVASKRNHEKLINLREIKFWELFSEFLKKNKYIKEDETKKYLECDNLNYNKTDDAYFGKIEYGDFGYSSEIVNVQTKKVTKDKTIDEAEKIPFYYIFRVFDNYAILLINQHKRRGIKTELQSYLGKFLVEKKVNAGYISLIINPLTSLKIDDIIEISELRFIRNRAPKDIERCVLKDIKLEEDLKPFIEEKKILIRDKKNFPFMKYLKKIKKLSQNNTEKKYMEIDGQIYDSLKFEVKMDDGRTKTIIVEKGLICSEGQEIDFENFPSLKEFYDKVISDFKGIVKDV